MEHTMGGTVGAILLLIIAVLWVLLPIVAFSIYQRVGKILQLQEEQTEYLRASTNALVKLASEVSETVGSPAQHLP